MVAAMCCNAASEEAGTTGSPAQADSAAVLDSPTALLGSHELEDKSSLSALTGSPEPAALRRPAPGIPPKKGHKLEWLQILLPVSLISAGFLYFTSSFDVDAR